MKEKKGESSRKEKILIIKPGYSEILDKENNSRIVSLGDVLRTTPLLYLFKNKFKSYHITWVCDAQAFPLLEDNKYIDRLLPFDSITESQLESEEYDVVINLEKIPGICALSDRIRARSIRYGFNFDTQTGGVKAYEKSLGVLAVIGDPKLKKENKRTAQELLFEIVGEKWNGEEYMLSYKPKTRKKYDIGLNTAVGTKWPTKAWSIGKWDKLEQKLETEGFKVTRQDKQGEKVTKNLYSYIDWINSCSLFVTNDSLGLHLALALKKKILGLFGPTPHREIYFYGRGKAILPKPPPKCMPCFKQKCQKGKSCIEDISVNRVYNEIKNFK